MMKCEYWDLLLLQIKDSVVCALVPTCEARIGDLVTCEDGIGLVVDMAECMTKDHQFVKFVETIIPVYEGVAVYNRGYAKGEETDGN